MKAFVFWTGIYNLLAGFSLFFPKLHRALGAVLPQNLMWTELLGFVVMFLGVMLVLCSRNLQARGSIVYWEGITRVLAFLVMGWFGFFGGVGAWFGVVGVIDLAIGIVYLLRLPGSLGVSHGQLLRDAV